LPLPTPPALGASALPAGTYAGQVVAVTGGGAGLGKGMALEFARLGAKIAILSRKPEHLTAGVEAMESVGASRRLRDELPGAILNIGATFSWTGGPGTAHSAAAKAGVTNLTQSLAVEWAPDDIRVNCLAPGRFPHEDLPDHMTRHRVGETGDSTIPAQRVGAIRELGWMATFMCSPYGGIGRVGEPSGNHHAALPP